MTANAPLILHLLGVVGTVAGSRGGSPIVVGDIVSSGRTGIETIKHLKRLSLCPATCVAIHAVSADNVCAQVPAAGFAGVVNIGSVTPSSDAILVAPLLAESGAALSGLLQDRSAPVAQP